MMDELFQSTGFAIATIGILGLELGASWLLRNYAAGIVWALSIIVLLFVALFRVEIEAFWLLNIGTMTLLIIGMVVRWTNE